MTLIDRKVYIYDIEPKIRDSLELIYFDSLTHESVNASDIEEPKAPEIIKQKTNDYKSDLYRFNLKRSLNNLNPLTEDEFENLLETQSIESLSGSEDEEEEETTELKFQALLKKMTINEDSTDEEKTISYLNSMSPFLMLKSPSLPVEKAYGVYKCMLNDDDLLGNPLGSLKGFSQLKTGRSALFMIGGGHFAGAIISHTPKNTRGNSSNTKQSLIEQSVQIIAHKTFHRYTTRRKQGGSQTASDNTRGKATSAGSSIRRYNEQALIKEVRELLDQWQSHLSQCTSIFIRANGSSNRKTLVGYEGAVLRSDDKRLRTFPFTTKRATAGELTRAWVELTNLKIVDLPKVKAIKRVEQTTSKTSAVPEETRTPDEIVNDNHTLELIGLLKKQKAPKFLSYIKSNKLDVNTFKLSPEVKYGNTPSLLHFASANELTHMIYTLINNTKADPAILNIFGRTPVEVTSDQETKKAFQVSRFKLGEDYCDWTKTKIGPPKSRDEFDKEDELANEKLKLEKQALIQEELSKKTEMELRKPKISSHGVVGGTPNLNDLTGLSDQQKMRLMREQRARAAEARSKKPQY